jgi:hypothetical protein
MTEAVLDAAERLGATLGPLLATAVLLAPPMLVLGSVSPFVVRLEGRLSSLGVTAGRVFALSTAGSLAGTFVASFWWIPDYGSRQTLRILVAALVVLGFAGLAWPRWRSARAALALVAAASPFVLPDPPLPPGIVFAAESPYNTVRREQAGSSPPPERPGAASTGPLGRGTLTGAHMIPTSVRLARGGNCCPRGGTTGAYRLSAPRHRGRDRSAIVRVAHITGPESA